MRCNLPSMDELQQDERKVRYIVVPQGEPDKRKGIPYRLYVIDDQGKEVPLEEFLESGGLGVRRRGQRYFASGELIVGPRRDED
jgi:hypothetical protein